MPFARQLAAEGFRAFPIGLPFRPLQNAGWHRDVVAAVDYLRRDGAFSVVLFVIASDSDRYLDARDANALCSESATTDKQLRIPRGRTHGTAILDGAEGPEVRQQIVGFVRSHSKWPG